MKAQHLIDGELAEARACAFLQRQQLVLVTRNFRTPYGELDLVMQDGEELVIVEVRFRKNARFGSAAESVSYAKQAKIIAATQCFLQTLTTTPNVRFDVVAITGQEAEMEWIQHAFEVEEAM